MPPQRATIAQERFSLASADLDTMLRLWRDRGGSSREFVDGTVELLAPNGERVSRGVPASIADQLRVRLARVHLLLA